VGLGEGEEKREGKRRAIKTPSPKWAGYGPVIPHFLLT